MNSVPSVGAEECFSVTGEIIHGKHLGRTLGYPTANLPRPEGVELPPNGVHVATMTVFTGPYAGQVFPCVLNQGSPPRPAAGPRWRHTYRASPATCTARRFGWTT